MATYYWVGGNGNWDASTTTNWASSSGGAGGAGVPTSADSVIFDANSNTGTTAFAVTVTGTSASPAVCLNFTTGGAGGALDGAMTLTLGATAYLNCYGSMTFPAANFSVSATAGSTVQFLTTGSDTLTTNGVSFGATSITLIGTGTLTLGSALTTTSSITVNGGTFTTSNFNLSCSLLQTSGATAKTINLGSSAVTVSGATPINFAGSNLTFNAGTSTITCSTASPTFNGLSKTFYNVTFSSTAQGTVSITGNNTFNNLTFTARAAAGVGQVALDAGGTTTVNGTLTLGSGTTGVARLWLRSVTVGSAHTLSVATLTAITDIDFRDITASGASSPWSGTRIGNALGNTNISFAAPRTVYWNSTASANWNAAVWSTTSGNTGGTTTAFPLAQDTIVIDNAGLGTGNTITVNASYNIGTLDFSTRSNAATFATGTGANPNFYGDLTYSSALTVSGTQTFVFAKQNGTATITSAGIAFTQNVTQQAPNGTVRINGALTLGSTNVYTLTQGTLDLTNNGAGNYTLTTGLFSSTNTNTRSIAFGTGNITVTGTGGVWGTGTSTNMTTTGTPVVNVTNSTATATTVNSGTLNEANSISFNFTAGTYTLTFLSVAYSAKNVDFTGFAGTWGATGSAFIYGNLTLSTGMTLTSSGSAMTFGATSGTKTITSNGKTIDFPLTFNGVGGIWQLQDALTQGSTRAFTITNGTVQLKSGITNTVGSFVTSGANLKALQSSIAGSQATLSQASGTVSVSYLSIKDSNATGGATWQAYTTNNNIDSGNNTGWDFGGVFVLGDAANVRLRSFTERGRD